MIESRDIALAARPEKVPVRTVVPAASPTTGSRVPCSRRFTAGTLMARPVVTVREDFSLWTAWGLLYQADYRYLVVVDGERRPVGVLDERAITRAWPPGPVEPHRVEVRDVLPARGLPHVLPDDDVGQVALSMLRGGVDALPVVDESGRLLGLVSWEHLARVLSECA